MKVKGTVCPWLHSALERKFKSLKIIHIIRKSALEKVQKKDCQCFLQIPNEGHRLQVCDGDNEDVHPES